MAFHPINPASSPCAIAHVPDGATNEFPLDAANCIKDYWGAGPAATYADFPLLGRGRFGEAIRIRDENDADFLPFLYLPRSRLHDSPLDIKGADRSVTVIVWAIRETANERVELHQYRYTRVRTTSHRTTDGKWLESGRELFGLRLNPRWYPHGLYSPPNDGSGGPFTIGRFIHSSRSVGFTGWIGGVAVFNRALSANELALLSNLSRP